MVFISKWLKAKLAFLTLAICLLFTVFTCSAQSVDTTSNRIEDNYNLIFPKPDSKAKPPRNWISIVRNNSIMPFRNEAVSVLVKFVVEIDGTISNIGIYGISLVGSKTKLQQPYDEIYQPFMDEAIRIVSLLKDFTPANLDGKLIRSRHVLPVGFY